MSRYSLGQVLQADGAEPVYVIWDSRRRQIVLRTDRWTEVLLALSRLSPYPPEPRNSRQR
jgi:hypothetical protein